MGDRKEEQPHPMYEVGRKIGESMARKRVIEILKGGVSVYPANGNTGKAAYEVKPLRVTPRN